jgi:hypothetical protein
MGNPMRVIAAMIDIADGAATNHLRQEQGCETAAAGGRGRAGQAEEDPAGDYGAP